MVKVLQRWRRKSKPQSKWDAGTPLVQLSRNDAWTIGHSFEGTLDLGSTGSGKTSGSGEEIARAMLKAGYGGVVCTAKAGERAQWERYAQETGRSKDLRIIGPDARLRLNPLDAELNRKGEGAGHTENIVSLLMSLVEVAERNSASGGGGRDDESYWRRAMRQLVRNLTDLSALATGRVSIPDLYRLVVSAPTSPAQVRDATWQERSFCYQCLRAADKREKTERQKHDFGLVADYFLLEYPALSDKTRSVIVSTFTSTIDCLNRGILRELFCTDTNITPEAVQDGAIIIVDLPVKEFGQVGQIANVLVKTEFQRSIERRDVSQSPRPVFLWADEAQHFVTSYDMLFQATCRAVRVATVYLSQNLSTFYAALGGTEKAKREVDSLLANLNTKIFHANADPVTNEWASSHVGRTRQLFVNGNNSYSEDAQLSAMFGLGYGGNMTAGFSESYEYELQPSVFTQLRTGGPRNGWLVDAVVFQNGRVFSGTGRTWLPVTFRQHV